MENGPVKTDDELLDDFINERHSDLPMDDELREALRRTFAFSGFKARYHEARLSNTINEIGEHAYQAGLKFSEFCKTLLKIK